MHAVRSPYHNPSYLVPDPNPARHRRVEEFELLMLFQGNNTGDIGFAHNALTRSNIIVDNDKIVGVVNWGMAGYFRWNAVAKVHLTIRSPARVSYKHTELEERDLSDILFWNDLYFPLDNPYEARKKLGASNPVSLPIRSKMYGNIINH